MKSKLPAAIALTLFGAVASSHATALYDPSVSSTTTVGDSMVLINGTLVDRPSNVRPFLVELYAAAGECLRIHVSSVVVATFDPELTVIAPNGTVYRNDDISATDLLPLVKIASAPVSGWYTVQVASYNGAPTTSNFDLRFGRFVAGNVNCASPTLPLVSQVSAHAVSDKE